MPLRLADGHQTPVLSSPGQTQVQKVLCCLHKKFQSQKEKAVFHASKVKRDKVGTRNISRRKKEPKSIDIMKLRDIHVAFISRLIFASLESPHAMERNGSELPLSCKWLMEDGGSGEPYFSFTNASACDQQWAGLGTAVP